MCAGCSHPFSFLYNSGDLILGRVNPGRIQPVDPLDSVVTPFYFQFKLVFNLARQPDSEQVFTAQHSLEAQNITPFSVDRDRLSGEADVTARLGLSHKITAALQHTITFGHGPGRQRHHAQQPAKTGTHKTPLKASPDPKKDLLSLIPVITQGNCHLIYSLCDS